MSDPDPLRALLQKVDAVVAAYEKTLGYQKPMPGLKLRSELDALVTALRVWNESGRVARSTREEKA